MFEKLTVKKITALLVLLFLTLCFVVYLKFFKKTEIAQSKPQPSEDILYNSNIREFHNKSTLNLSAKVFKERLSVE